jgi:hypothetical protein
MNPVFTTKYYTRKDEVDNEISLVQIINRQTKHQLELKPEPVYNDEARQRWLFYVYVTVAK